MTHTLVRNPVLTGKTGFPEQSHVVVLGCRAGAAPLEGAEQPKDDNGYEKERSAEKKWGGRAARQVA
jgi:hypothetical protein